MELTEIGPYLISGLVGLITAWLTHKRANRVHKDTVVIDQQKLVNDTYEAVLAQLREELSRRQKAHDTERVLWELREDGLKAQVSELRGKIQTLQEQVNELRQAEKAVQERQSHHFHDEARHLERRSESRNPQGDSGTDLPT